MKRPFHEIQSIMQSVSLYDYLTITIKNSSKSGNEIHLEGNSPFIPYDENNLVFKAVEMFLKKSRIKNLCQKNINIYIEKNIPVAAGLAGGSSNAAGALLGMNKLLKNPLILDHQPQ